MSLSTDAKADQPRSAQARHAEPCGFDTPSPSGPGRKDVRLVEPHNFDANQRSPISSMAFPPKITHSTHTDGRVVATTSVLRPPATPWPRHGPLAHRRRPSPPLMSRRGAKKVRHPCYLPGPLPASRTVGTPSATRRPDVHSAESGRGETSTVTPTGGRICAGGRSSRPTCP